MDKKVYFPFTAIVGQEKMKRALILNLINPALGGVLIKGEKGTVWRLRAVLFPATQMTGAVCAMNAEAKRRQSP